MNRLDDIVICGLGSSTSVGLHPAAAAAAVRASISGFGAHDFAVDDAGDPICVAAVPGLGVEAQGAQRFARLAESALIQLSAVFDDSVTPLPLLVGLPTPRPGLEYDLRSTLRSIEPVRNGRLQLFATGGGHCAGLRAIAECAKAVAAGRFPLGIAGGLDSWLEPRTLEWLESVQRLHTSRNPWGFIPGEAAAFCVIATIDEAHRRALPILARVLGTGEGIEPHPISSDGVSRADGLCGAVTAALEDVDGTVDWSICDMNGEPYRADEYGFLAIRLRERFAESHAFSTPADCWGDIGAASGPLFVCLAADRYRNAYASGPNALLWASADTGERVAIMLGDCGS